MDDPNMTEMLSQRPTMDSQHGVTIAASNPSFHPPPTQQSFYRKYIASATSAHGSTFQQPIQIADLSETFASLDPSTIVACLHNAITVSYY
jgi:hypothetical protein